MKKVIAVVVLAVVAIGLGGWFIYNQNTQQNNNTGAATVASGDTIDVKGRNLTSVGPDIYNQTNTTTLILSYNNLKSLPSQMGRMTHLSVLQIDRNQLEGSLIAEIRMMPLTKLDVSYNHMTGMPAEIGQIHTLVDLDYSYNQLTALPNEIANLKNNLKTLNLTGNPLSQSTINKLKTELPNTTITF